MKVHDGLSETQREFCLSSPVFFVATSPLNGHGHVNISPKGHVGTAKFLDGLPLVEARAAAERRSRGGPGSRSDRMALFAYLDLGGSGLETVAHLRENGRVTVMFMATTPGSPPKILRVYGCGFSVEQADGAVWTEMISRAGWDLRRFPEAKVRNVIVVAVDRVADSCGYGVPFLEMVEEREVIPDKMAAMAPDQIWERRKTAYSTTSIDGLPTLRRFDGAADVSFAESALRWIEQKLEQVPCSSTHQALILGALVGASMSLATVKLLRST